MTEIIHALLIEDNRIEAHQTQHWLAESRLVSIEVEWVERLSAGLERLSRSGVDVVLLDLNLPDSRGLETLTSLHQRVPGVPIIVLTGEHDESIGILAVQQGADDYLVKQQVDGDKLPKIIYYAVARHKAQVERASKEVRPTNGRVISFLGAKGGMGTTTVAVNVAVALAESGNSVILAELKPTFGSLASSLQAKPPTSLANLTELPADRVDEHELGEVLCQGPAGIRILFGSHMSEMRRELDFEHTEAIIKGFTHLANFVILDLPGWPSAATAAAARLSQFVGVVTAREPLAVRCGHAAVNQLKAWGISGGLVGAIVVGQSGLPLAMEMSDIQSQLGCGILRIVPPTPAACSKANKDGVPLVLSQPDNEAAEAYIDIAKLLVDDRGIKMDV